MENGTKTSNFVEMKGGKGVEMMEGQKIAI
jgi:hypothetical protein